VKISSDEESGEVEDLNPPGSQAQWRMTSKRPPDSLSAGVEFINAQAIKEIDLDMGAKSKTFPSEKEP
jgi:hypothetical protein